MRTAKSLENWVYSSDTLKTKATTARRLLGGIKNIDVGALELTSKESQQLADAISLISKISDLYAEGARLKKRTEKAEAIERENIAKMVNASGFGQLTSVGDKVAFISHINPYDLSDADKNKWNAEYCVKRSFMSALDGLCYDVANVARRNGQTYQEALDAAWKKFQESLPERCKRYEGLIERIEKLLAGDPATA